MVSRELQVGLIGDLELRSDTTIYARRQGELFSTCEVSMRTSIDILVVDDSDHDAALTLYALRNSAPDLNALRVLDGEQALQFIWATGGYAGTAPRSTGWFKSGFVLPPMKHRRLAIIQAHDEQPGTPLILNTVDVSY